MRGVWCVCLSVCVCARVCLFLLVCAYACAFCCLWWYAFRAPGYFKFLRCTSAEGSVSQVLPKHTPANSTTQTLHHSEHVYQYTFKEAAAQGFLRPFEECQVETLSSRPALVNP